MESLSIDLLYQVAMAMLARELRDGSAETFESVEKALDSINPLEQVEQTRRDDGILEHDPNMTIPGWGYSDPSDMDLGQASASAMYSPASE